MLVLIRKDKKRYYTVMSLKELEKYSVLIKRDGATCTLLKNYCLQGKFVQRNNQLDA